jgi:two-component system, NtrC family, C4-dicarboxylate transport sensor histidine kinase DctB
MTYRASEAQMLIPKKLLWPFGAAAIIIALIAAIFALVGHLATQNAVNSEAERVRNTSVLLVSSFRNDLKRFRLALNILDQDPDLGAALINPNVTRIAALNLKFEGLAANMDGASIYLIDATGMTIAASNWRLDRSFVGHNYAFRPYHQQAMQHSEGEQFALGTISGKPGLHIARRIDAQGRHLGVVVIKVLFEALENEWRQSGKIAFATDHRGIILVTSQPEWRFQTISTLPAEQRLAIRNTRDFGDAPITVNRLFETDGVGPVGTRSAYVRPYIDAVETLADKWTIHALAPTADIVHLAKRNARLSAAGALLLTAAVFAILYFRQRSAKAGAELAASERLRLLNERLMQTNRLATLGQIAAGVGHEINQPLAAIAAYADSGSKLITIGNTGEASENLRAIATLTDRIGGITSHLRSFARKSTGTSAPISLEQTISGALLLLRDRIATLSAKIEVSSRAHSCQVWAEPIRLEQVFVNLLQNALDAGGAGVVINIGVERRDAIVEVTVRDNGPGLSDVVREGLFQPFSTSKSDGLGLGLVISRDIMADFGGELVANQSTSGAEFVVRLRAQP